MKIVVLTEGASEYKSLPLLFVEIHGLTENRLLSPPLKVNISPDAPPKIIAKACSSRLKLAAAEGAEAAVLILDREKQTACPGLIARKIESEIDSLGLLATYVVLKNRTFENWLISDLSALKAQKARFKVTAALEKKISPNKADSCDGLDLIKRMIVSGQYEKMQDGNRICAKMSVLKAAKNSRSMRHFLHVLDCSPYSDGCKVP